MLLWDARYAIRAMSRAPLFTLVACLTLAFTIGAVSTVLTLVDTLLFKPLPVPDPEQVIEVKVTQNHSRDLDHVSYADYTHFRDHTRSLAGLAAHYPSAPLFVEAGDLVREINGSVVSANYFPLLGIEPALGRFFRADEDEVPDRDRVAVISHDLWRTVFDRSPDVLDETLKINGETFSVVGVVPAFYKGMTSGPSLIYIPTMMLRLGYRWCEDALSGDCTMLRMVGRLTDGQDAAAAEAELAVLMPPHWAALPQDDRPTGVVVERLRGALTGEQDRQVVLPLSIVAGILLLVCAANLAGLLTARGNARMRELAIRASLGANASRLMRQLLTESLLLALVGGGLGILLSIELTGLLNTMFYSADYAGRPLYFDFSLEPGVVASVFGLSVATGLLFGSLPAFRAARLDTAERLRDRGSLAGGGWRTTRWLVGAQATVATGLVIVAALLSSSAGRLVQGMNFDSSDVALLRLRPRLVGYSPEEAQRFTGEAVRRLEALPEVESVSLVGTGVSFMGFRTQVWLPGSAESQSHRVGCIEVSPHYFETLRIPFLLGRDFDDRDGVDSPPVAIVSQALAERLWPGGDAIGAWLVLEERRHQVIGVVKDVPLHSRGEALQPYVYRSYWQNPERIDARVQVRVAGDPSQLLPRLIREVHAVDPAVPIANTVTLADNMAGRFRQLRMSATAVSYAGLLVLVLSGMGLYGALAFSVSRRTKEIGVRMAIGAHPRQLLSAVIGQGMGVIGIGVLAGLISGLAGARLLQNTLYGSFSGDVALYGAAAAMVVAVGLLACWLPARRAATVDPMVALRDE